MERLQQDSTVPLEQHKQDVMGAIEDAVEKATTGKGPGAPAAGGGSGGEDNFINHSIFTTALGPAAVVMPMGTDKANAQTVPKTQGSLFLGESALGKSARAGVSIMPAASMSYGDRKAAAALAAKGGAPAAPGRPGEKPGTLTVASRANIASQSLTGTGTAAGGKATCIKGATITPAMAESIGAGWLLDELAVTNRTMLDPYTNSPKRLAADLVQGKPAAEAYVERAKPENLKMN